jgi:hypothetical protein
MQNIHHYFSSLLLLWMISLLSSSSQVIHQNISYLNFFLVSCHRVYLCTFFTWSGSLWTEARKKGTSRRAAASTGRPCCTSSKVQIGEDGKTNFICSGFQTFFYYPAKKFSPRAQHPYRRVVVVPLHKQWTPTKKMIFTLTLSFLKFFSCPQAIS